MSDTPRGDEIIVRCATMTNSREIATWTSEYCKLERELSAMTKERDDLRNRVASLERMVTMLRETEAMALAETDTQRKRAEAAEKERDAARAVILSTGAIRLHNWRKCDCQRCAEIRVAAGVEDGNTAPHGRDEGSVP